MSQQHSFISYIKNKHSFELTIFGLIVTASWRINFIQYFRITILGPILTMTCLVPLEIAKIKLTILNSLIKLIVSPTAELLIKKTKFTFVMKQAMKFTRDFIISETKFTLIMQIVVKLGLLDLIIPKIRMVSTILLARFYALWEYDNKKLWQMDNVKLVDLDYTEL
jgi:hypothetical protein